MFFKCFFKSRDEVYIYETILCLKVGPGKPSTKKDKDEYFPSENKFEFKLLSPDRLDWMIDDSLV